MTVVRMHRPADRYPNPEYLAPLRPFLVRLRDMAAEYDDIAEDGELTTAAEFIEWIAHDIERAAAHRNLIRAGSHGGSAQPRARSRSR